MKIFLITLLSFTFTISSFANKANETIPPLKGKISGIVKEKQLDAAIEYASIIIFSLADSVMLSGTVSGKKGQFEITNIPEGSYYLIVDFMGYKEKKISNITITKKNKKIDVGDILLDPANYQLDEVTVRAAKNYVDFKIDRKVVNVSRQANAAGGTLSEVLENVPSVNVDIEGNITLRGSSSFTVLIDGKPSPISGSEILKQIPAATVENVEIITNPSAKYDPEGTTGIINIIMKKGYQEGLNGLISGNYATWNKIGGDINLNYRKKKVNYFLIANYNKNPRLGISENKRETYFDDNTYFVDEKTERERTMKPFKINPGLDIYINDKNTLSISGTYGGWGMDRVFDTEYTSYTEENVTNKTYSISKNDFSIDGKYYVLNSNFQHLFSSKDHKIDFNVTTWNWNNLQSENSFEQNADRDLNPLSTLSNLRSNLDEKRNNIHIKTDYTQAFKKGKIELGFDIRLAGQDADFVYENQDLLNDQWLINPDFTYKSTFYRNLYAAYGTYSANIYGLAFQAGLRAEKTDRNISQIDLGTDYPLELLKFYPSFHVSKNINERQQMQLSYSRRINRPQPWQLNPYPGYSDSYNYFQGNPLLRPEDTDAFELNYIHRLEKLSFSMGGYYRQSFHSQTMVQKINESDPNVVYLTFGNLDRTTSLGMEYMFNFFPSAKMNFNLSGNIYNFNVYSSFLGEDEHRNSVNWDARLNSSFNLGKTSRLLFTGIYNGPTVNGQGNTKAFYYFDLGLRKSFMNRRLNASLLVHNVFRNGRYETMVENKDFNSWFYYKGESPVVRISISYMINQFKRKQRANVNIGAGAS